MIRTKTTIRMSALAVLFIGIVAALLRTVVLLNYYDVQSGYFDKADPGILPALMWIAVIAGMVFGAAVSFVRSKRIAGFERISGLRSMIGSVVLVFCFLVVFFYELSGAFGTAAVAGLDFAIAVFAVVAAGVVLTKAFLPAKGVKYTRAVMGLSSSVVCVLLAFQIYICDTTVMNDPNKTVFISTAIVSAVMFVFECRFNTESSNSAVYTALCFATLAMGLFCGVPNVIWWMVNGKALMISAAPDVLCVGISIYALAGIYSIHHKVK